jgi:hypothetical protein
MSLYILMFRYKGKLYIKHQGVFNYEFVTYILV